MHSKAQLQWFRNAEGKEMGILNACRNSAAYYTLYADVHLTNSSSTGFVWEVVMKRCGCVFTTISSNLSKSGQQKAVYTKVSFPLFCLVSSLNFFHKFSDRLQKQWIFFISKVYIAISICIDRRLVLCCYQWRHWPLCSSFSVFDRTMNKICIRWRCKGQLYC